MLPCARVGRRAKRNEFTTADVVERLRTRPLGEGRLAPGHHQKLLQKQ